MDRATIGGMNKSQLMRELKKVNLSSKGKKHELANRLERHFADGSQNGSDGEGDTSENALERAERLQREITDRQNELTALRREFHNSTNDIAVRATQASNIVERIVQTAAPQQTTQTHTVMHSNVFSFRDMGDALNSFSGEDAYTVKKWITEIEENTVLFNWSPLQQIVYAKKLLSGTAKRFLRTIETTITTWNELKIQLLSEFDRTKCAAEVHKEMSEMKKSTKEIYHDFLLRVCEIGNTHKIGDESTMKYVINGIPDELYNKQMLHGATTMTEFKRKYFAYEKFKNEFAHEERGKR